jgi:hypothetical protein
MMITLLADGAAEWLTKGVDDTTDRFPAPGTSPFCSRHLILSTPWPRRERSREDRHWAVRMQLADGPSRASLLVR